MRMILMIGTAAVLSAASIAMAETAARVAVSIQHIRVTGSSPVLPGGNG